MYSVYCTNTLFLQYVQYRNFLFTVYSVQTLSVLQHVVHFKSVPLCIILNNSYQHYIMHYSLCTAPCILGIAYSAISTMHCAPARLQKDGNLGVLLPDLEIVKKFTQARFYRVKFYPKERKLQQMPNCDKTAKNRDRQ